MAKVTTGEHAGCSVSGRILNAAGGPAVKTISIKPERGVLRGGVWYPPDAATVAVDPDGRWGATLLPSSVCGTYQVHIGRQEFLMTVPDGERAEFAEISQVVAVPRRIRQ